MDWRRRGLEGFRVLDTGNFPAKQPIKNCRDWRVSQCRRCNMGSWKTHRPFWNRVKAVQHIVSLKLKEMGPSLWNLFRSNFFQRLIIVLEIIFFSIPLVSGQRFC